MYADASLTSRDRRAMPARQWSTPSLRSPPVTDLSASCSICVSSAVAPTVRPSSQSRSGRAETARAEREEIGRVLTRHFMRKVPEESFFQVPLRRRLRLESCRHGG